MSRRRGSARAVVVIWWRDIPAQVTAGGPARGSGPSRKVLLDARFQHAIDRAAVVAGCTDTTSYVAEWRRTSEPLEGDPEAEARRAANALETAFPAERLEQLVRTGGWDRSPETTDDPAGPAESSSTRTSDSSSTRTSDRETPAP